MTLRLRNTLTRTVEPIRPADGREVRMYTCGPTVYRYAHIGNLRTFMLADFIRRAVLYHGIAVRHVKNVTDVGHMRDEQRDSGGDRILLQAQIERQSAREIAGSYERAFHDDEAAVNILSADSFPRATEHVPNMIRLAEQLEDRGLTYRSADGTLYYDVSSFSGYGQLSNNSLDALRAGHRGPVEAGKHDPADFALWKVAEPGRELVWPSERWGIGFPGWHLECSAMSLRYLGDEFDVHTGGVDNIFPHHENEIAQSAAVTGKNPARVWVHGEHLLTSGRKMAKSAGNLMRVTDLPQIGVEPVALRYLVLTARYGHKLHASAASLRAAQAGLDSLLTRLRALGAPPDSGAWARPPRIDEVGALSDRAHGPVPWLSATGAALHARFTAALDDDLDLPAALAVVRETLRADLAPDEKRWLVLDADAVLGLGLSKTWDERARIDASEVAELKAARTEARAAGDYATSDALRDQLRALGVDVVDRKD